MGTYTFVAKDKQGRAVRDRLQAKTRYEAMSKLAAQELAVISLDSVAEDITEGKKAKTGIKKLLSSFFVSRRIRLNELSVFCRQLSVCITSGVNLIEALDSIANDMENPHFKAVLSEVNSDVKEGAFFSEAIARHEKVFGAIFVALMRAAEESGSLHTVLEYMSIYLESSVRLERKIRSITAYPMFIAAFFIIVVIIATLFILPRFESLFSGFGAQLPKISRIVFAVNRFFLNNILFFAAVLIGAVAGFITASRFPKSRYYVDFLKLKIPLFGSIIRKSSIARFCRILSITIRGGVPVVKAIDITSRASRNMVLEKSLNEIRRDVMQGGDIASSIEKREDFPKLVGRMIWVGEASGKLPEVLNKISDMYEDEVDGAITVAASLFEPIIIILFGIVVLILALAIYVPIFKIAMTMKAATF